MYIYIYAYNIKVDARSGLRLEPDKASDGQTLALLLRITTSSNSFLELITFCYKRKRTK